MKVFEKLPELVRRKQWANEQKMHALIEQIDLEFEKAMRDAPNGSGFDSGTKLESATDREMVFTTSFHHMDDNGSYCGWTDHRIIIKSVFSGFRMRIIGPNTRGIKDYIGDVFNNWLNGEVA